MSLSRVAGLLMIAALAACSSNPHKAENVKTEMDKTQEVSGGYQIGLKDDQMVVQRKALVAEELRNLQIEVHTLEDRTYGGDRYYGNPGLWGVLNDCRIRLASATNGGTGKLNYIEPREYVIDDKEYSAIGIDEKGNLVTVSEEYLKDRLSRYRQYRKVLMERNRQLQDKSDMCKLELEAQRSK